MLESAGRYISATLSASEGENVVLQAQTSGQSKKSRGLPHKVLRIRAMARSTIAVLVCALMVSSLLENLPFTSAQDDSLAGLQQQSLGQYQQEEAQEIEFNMQMQKLQAEGKMADNASGAQLGGGRRLVQDLAALEAQSLGQYQQQQAEDIEFNSENQKLHAEGYGEDAQIGSRRRLVQDLRPTG